MIHANVVDMIGHTPLLRLRTDDAPGTETYAKLELQNPFAMKDRVARQMVLEARRIGTLAPGAPIIESSSGTMALGLALVGAALGHPVHIVTDPRIDPITLEKLRALDCTVHVVEKMSAQGWQSARLEMLADLRRDLPHAFWPQQYRNPDNPRAYETLAAELLDDLGEFDVLVGSTGSGGSLCGTARALRRRLPQLRVVGVDCVGSVLFDQPDEPGRLQSGLGNSLHPYNLDRRLLDEIHWLNDREAFDSTRDLAREQQIFAGNTSGSVYRVLRRLARTSPEGSRIVGILPDRGDRYTGTVYDDRWAADRLAALPARQVPHTLGAGEVAIAWSSSTRTVPEGLPQHLLFVESNTTGTGMLAIRQAQAIGLVPVLLTDRPSRYRGLDETGCEVLEVATGTQAALRAAIQERFPREQIAGVTTTSDFYTHAVAELAAWLGAPGADPDAVAACRNKRLLSDVLGAAGVPQPATVAVTSPDAVADAVAVTGLPCVIKPADGSGSQGVRLCATAEEAVAGTEALLRTVVNVRGLPTAGEVLVQQYVTGPEYSVEIVGDGTRLHCVGITEKSVTGAPYFVETGHVFPAALDSQTAAQITRAVEGALTAVGLTWGASHTEVKWTPAGPVIIEINPRPAGGMIPELVRLVTGIDLVGEQLNAAAGRDLRLHGATDGCAGIRFLLAAHPGVLTTITGANDALRVPGVRAVTITATAGDEVRPPRDAYDRLGYVIATGSRQHVHDALDSAHTRLSITVDPTPVPDESPADEAVSVGGDRR
ncbi:pyridoxal-phosphate dependent enzyme [Catenuloplanes japonicus]|uniref:pyridoxal-phosphate dependent enzyme n=1 Tax=Catenuloplanes japonicus TaxID=33876 RepID=UPI000524678C|nr:pyridoxal-phosphate dependent enzyme [Catenuloplanes japonicus]